MTQIDAHAEGRNWHTVIIRAAAVAASGIRAHLTRQGGLWNPFAAAESDPEWTWDSLCKIENPDSLAMPHRNHWSPSLGAPSDAHALAASAGLPALASSAFATCVR